ncbi:phosphatase PAP2 family protein [Arthrobacter castelli]|uniref:phosphatase PAP2 family protein n=1 Tax=Arthrobacter castelli TaxID=271431 RepID=UPI0006853DA7|nr:phosphatase PAP2 family protein [Arthrobacter castelli]
MNKRSARQTKAGRRPAKPAASNPFPFIAAALLCAGSLVGIYILFVRTTTGQLIGEGALREAELSATGMSSRLQDFLDLLPLISAVIAAAFILFVTLARRRWLAAGVAIAAALGANLTTQVLKEVLVRPELGVQTLGTNSLPSGHATLAASSAAAVILVVAPRWRPLAAAGGGSYAVIAGAATLINLWHRPADIIAAFLVVGFWTAVGGWIIMRTGTAWNVWSGFGEHWAASRVWPAGTAAAGLVTGLMAVLFVLVSTPTLTTPAAPERLPLLYWAGLAMIVSSGYLLASLGAVLFGRAARIRR